MNKDLVIFFSFWGIICTFLYFAFFHSFYKTGDCLLEFHLRDKNEFNVKARITVMQIEKVGYYSYLVNKYRPIDNYKVKQVNGKSDINPMYNVYIGDFMLSSIFYKRAEKSICEKTFTKDAK
jgi:hypothetical protein